MSQRRLLDADGAEWLVYDVVARGDLAHLLTPAGPLVSDDASDDTASHRSFTTWLCFESGPRRRRLHPIPENWERASQEELRGLLLQAAPAAPLGDSR